MSESPPPAVAGDAAVERAPALTPERIAAVLADFRSWLDALPGEAEEPPADAEAGPDLFTLLGQLAALRHEVNLQTKAARALQEQNESALNELSRALDALGKAQADVDRQQDDRLRPLLKTLVELHDALAVAAREAQRVQDAVLPALRQAADGAEAGPPEPPPVTLPAVARWLGARAPDFTEYRSSLNAWRQREEERSARARESAERIGKLLGSLTTGYAMGLQRVERALRQHGLEALPAVGEAFDPERMEAVEAVADSGSPPGRVLGEVQRGYLWNGRVFRYACVRVAK